MLKSYFKTAVRNFLKNKLVTIINLLGISIGISAAIIVFLIIQYDYSFDKYEPQRSQLYRVVQETQDWKIARAPEPMTQALRSNVPGIDRIAPIVQYFDWNNIVSVPEGKPRSVSIFHSQKQVAFVDENYFKVFPHQWLAGNSASLKQPYNVILSRSDAQLYFPNSTPDEILGRTVVFGDTLRTKVSGVIDDLQDHSDFEFRSLISMPTISFEKSLKSQFSWGDWGSSSTTLMIKLSSHIKADQIEKRLTLFLGTLPKNGTITRSHYFLQPLKDIHTDKGLGGTVDNSILINLSLLAAFILFLSTTNYINLSTAQSTLRAKEIGIRKTLGSGKMLLVIQFLFESLLLTVLAAGLSILITPLLASSFKGFIPKGLHLNFFSYAPGIGLYVLLLILILTILAGLYPATVLAKLSPSLVIKGQNYSYSGRTFTFGVRKALIVFQFVIAQIFLIGMLVVHKQVHYSLQKNMGVRKNAIIYFNMPERLYSNQDMNARDHFIREQLQTIPEIQEAGLGSVPPISGRTRSTRIISQEDNEQFMVDARSGDSTYLKIYNIKLIAGRNVSTCNTPCEALINQTLSKRLGYFEPQKALGHKIAVNGSWLQIVGVTKDFNLESIRTPIHPFVFYSDNKGIIMHVALQPNSNTWKSTIAKIEKICKATYPNWDFDYSFFDKSIQNLYKEDEQLSSLLDWAAGIAIFISCLGLLGLVIFTANNRRKEIGIRKVLGASIADIVISLSKDFIPLLILALLIALPIAWWKTHIWLRNFAYHTELSWWLFAASAISMVVIAMLILSIKIISTASANPIEALSSE
ncbi:MAG: ABC transporter permease [Bacteroidota bacterium]|nr:ABC transporter permease [Bacteroidota bacterium]